jgi:uncharacterized membrane protein YccC
LSDDLIKLTAHPRAQRDIRRAKGWGGLAAFGVTLYVSHGSGVPMADAILRSIAVGLIGMLVCWAAAIAVWRQLAVAEIESARRRLIEAHRRAMNAEADGS